MPKFKLSPAPGLAYDPPEVPDAAANRVAAAFGASASAFFSSEAGLASALIPPNRFEVGADPLAKSPAKAGFGASAALSVCGFVAAASPNRFAAGLFSAVVVAVRLVGPAGLAPKRVPPVVVVGAG